MPEQLTKHPEVTLQVLRSAGASCAAGDKQEILVKCPPERFCKLPGGEICVYGLNDAARMTQITVTDWRALPIGPKPDAPAWHAVPFGTFLLAIVASLMLGVVLAAGMRRLRRRRSAAGSRR